MRCNMHCSGIMVALKPADQMVEHFEYDIFCERKAGFIYSINC